ncbi:uncharacterized protein LOC128728595 [Anopheles nili]|uniref:uncharacterized protein LOC128728595 n=1 Tax=Anopheles nili TaxID=185578 RepID=UPI00237B822C|nr:uncharacterized protein LOC128728595 [Anopheles nili]
MAVLPRFRRWLVDLFTEQDLFRPYELLVAGVGFYLPASFRTTRIRLLFALTRLIMVCQYAIWADRFYLSLLDIHDDPGKALQYTNSFLTLSMMLGRMLVVHWYRLDVERIMAFLRRQRRAMPISEREVSYRRIVGLAGGFQLIGILDRVLVCFSTPYRQLLYEVPANMAALGRPASVIVQAISFDFATRWAAAYNVSLTGMNSLMSGLHDELADIARDYGKLLDVEDLPGATWTRFVTRTTRVVRRHEAFLEQLNMLKPFLCTAFLVMFYSAALFLAIGTHQITSATNGFSMYHIVLGGYLCTLLIECYRCCQLVDQLNDLNKQIGQQLYGLEWPLELRYSPQDDRLYRQTRSSLLIMMSSSQRSLGITCGGMFEMSSEAFASLIKMIYTLVRFLSDTQNLT